MQWRYEEEQQLLAQLEEAAKLRQAECAAQKARRKAEAKAKEEAERQSVVATTRLSRSNDLTNK